VANTKNCWKHIREEPLGCLVPATFAACFMLLLKMSLGSPYSRTILGNDFLTESPYRLKNNL
jgi:hypothetical protein